MSKSHFKTLMAFAMMGIMLSDPSMGHRFEITQEELEKLKQIAALKRKQRLLERGVKEWNINGIIVLARDDKNAKRKVENIIQELKQDGFLFDSNQEIKPKTL